MGIPRAARATINLRGCVSVHPRNIGPSLKRDSCPGAFGGAFPVESGVGPEVVVVEDEAVDVDFV